jgi:hypothetical protein
MVWKVRGSNSGRSEIFFSFRKLPGLALENTQLPLQGRSSCFPEKMRPICNADHSFPSRTKAKNEWSCTSASPIYLQCGLTTLPLHCILDSVVHNNVSCNILSQHGNSEKFQSLTKTVAYENKGIHSLHDHSIHRSTICNALCVSELHPCKMPIIIDRNRK